MRSGACVRFLGTGGLLLAVGLLLSNGTWGACPDTERYKCLCLLPPTTVDCGTLPQKVCEESNGQVKLTCYWDCKYAEDCGTECVDGEEEALCYVDYECEWNTTQNKCQIDVDTDVWHTAPLKVNKSCSPPS